jgi:amidohydrolase
MHLLNTIRMAATELQPQLVDWRRDFHMHPELGFQEFRTGAIVADHLRSLGLEVSTGIGRTGVVAVVEPDKAPVDAPTVLLRFDMDALPVDEQNDLPYKSQNPGVMHACGHDGHTAIGMGVATLLAQHRNQLAGRVKLVFQPAEEGLGGAKAMIEDGVMNAPAPAAAFGLHLWNRFPLNQLVVQPGPLWASAGIFHLTVHGRSGHGAEPHESIDATLIASQIVVAWQSIVARNVDPAQTAVVSVCTFQSGEATNIISGVAKLSGTIRSFKPEIDNLLRRRMHEIAHALCTAFGATCELEFSVSIPATINSEAGASLMHKVATQLVEPAQVTQITPMMVGEDMSEFLNRAPGCFVLVGAADPDRPLHGSHHNAKFNFDERMLSTGVALLAGAAVTYLAENRLSAQALA